jgi:hypothetical protein
MGKKTTIVLPNSYVGVCGLAYNSDTEISRDSNRFEFRA